MAFTDPMAISPYAASGRNPFDFKNFNEDLTPGLKDIFNTDRGGFMDYLLQRAGTKLSPYQSQFSGQSGDWIMSLLPMMAASGGVDTTKAAGLEGANIFGNLLEEYLRPHSTAGSMSGNALSALRGMAGKSQTGSETVKNYLDPKEGGTNRILGQVMAILRQRMGDYMFENLMGSRGSERLANEYAMAGEGGGQQDILQFLQSRGVI